MTPSFPRSLPLARLCRPASAITGLRRAIGAGSAASERLISRTSSARWTRRKSVTPHHESLFFDRHAPTVKVISQGWKFDGRRTQARFRHLAILGDQTMIDIKPNLAEAVAFAFSLPTDQAHLCAIHPTGNRQVVGRSFTKTEAGEAAALRWLESADRMGYGIYFNANEVKSLGKAHAKAKEAEVSTVRFLHVDADLPAGTAPDDVETVRAELLAKIKAAPLVPSLIINSGNGFGLFWDLAEPITVTDENRDDIKARNIALADQLGGDDCENLDRVMRLPFTVNRPNAKKIKAGRVHVLADVVSDLRGLVVYTVEEFTPAAVSNEMTTTLTKSSGTAYETIASPDIPETVDLSTLDESLRSIIENGPPTGYAKSRSEAVYMVACDLRRFGWSDGNIL